MSDHISKEPVQKQTQPSLFQSFFSKNKSSPVMNELNKFPVQTYQQKQMEYVVLPARLVAAYANDQNGNITPVAEAHNQSPQQIAIEMEQLRKQRAEAQNTAQVAILNTRLRDQDKKLDDLMQLIKDMSKEIHSIKDELKDVKQTKSYESKQEPKHANKPAFGEMPPMVKTVVNQTPAAEEQNIQPQQTQQLFTNLAKPTPPQEAAKPAVQPTQTAPIPAQEPAPKFTFGSSAKPAESNPFATTPAPQTAAPAAFGQAAPAAPSAPAAFGQAAPASFGQPASKFSFQPTTAQPAAPAAPVANQPSKFSFGANENKEVKQEAAGFKPFGAPSAGFGQGQAPAFTFGASTSANPFDSLFAAGAKKQ